MKVGKKDGIFSNSPLLFFLSSACINQFTLPDFETNLEYGSDFSRRLTKICNLRIYYPNEELLPHDDDVSGAFKYTKYHPDVAAEHYFKLDENICIPLGIIFSSNVSPHEFQVISKSRVRKAE